MKVITLNCNHCGAPLEVSQKAKFVTCGFCDARLVVEHTGSSYSTAVLDDIKQTTDQIARDVAQIKSNRAVEQLDSKWEQDRKQFLVAHKNGAQSLPTKPGAIFSGIFIVGFGIFWTIIAFGITGAGRSMGAPGFVMIFPLLGILFVAMGIFSVFRIFTKAEDYNRAQQRYRRDRQQLVTRSPDE